MSEFNLGALDPLVSSLPAEHSANSSSSSLPSSSSSSSSFSSSDVSAKDKTRGVVGAKEERQGASEERGEQAVHAESEEEGRQREREGRARARERWRGVLGSEELLTERDEGVLASLETKEPSILDEVCRYWLHAVGCSTTDRTVARLVSVSVQLALEHIIDDAKLFYFCRRAVEGRARESSQGRDRGPRGGGAGGFPSSLLSVKTPGDYRELDVESFCQAFRKNGDSLVGPNLDLFLDASSAPLPSTISSSLSSSSLSAAPSSSSAPSSSASP
ncbi:transcription initiation factor TFIID 23-30 kDa subunit [Toxoplasma gondii ARI]|uniref:Transcription initiation factor TFIID 23-30 kDa subunit n=1 Tax=Toxoplasma gondii ARI TaxID=1074872 RepID=A0A139XN10_TOXGO|nr:transcription initiation factor TFIID 23-30 kDa subunit [Toxoplasma gondii ARI]